MNEPDITLRCKCGKALLVWRAGGKCTWQHGENMEARDVFIDSEESGPELAAWIADIHSYLGPSLLRS